MKAVFVDDQDNFAELPSALSRVALSATMADGDGDDGQGTTGDPEDQTVPTAAEQRAFRDVEGLMALCRAMAHIKLKAGSGWAALATATRDQYADETGDSLETDLFAAFDDA